MKWPFDAANAASLSNKLLQMANGAVYDENKEARTIHSRKVEMLEDLIEAANGKPVLVAYWYQHDLERIRKRLDGKKIEYDKIDKIRGMDIVFVTTAKTDAEARDLLGMLGAPFAKEGAEK